MTEQDRLRQCVEHIYWDLIDAYGVARGRKNELTFVSGVIQHMSTVTKLRMQDVADILEVSRSTVTDYVDYLEKRGYVRRERGSEDRRGIFVVPTEKGREWVAGTKKQAFGYVNEGMSRLTPAEREAFVELLAKFVGDSEQPPYMPLMSRRPDEE
jgi:DNA-binding MarR family transcriptional regulator